MAQKRHLESIPELLSLCLKFLYSLTYIETLSHLTCRAYRSDLAQAFGFERSLLELDTTATPLKIAVPERVNSDALLAICRDAMSRWSGLSPASRNRKAACLKSFLNWLREKEVVERELAPLIFGPKVPVRLPHHISVDEAMALINALEQDAGLRDCESLKEGDVRMARRDLALILLLYGGGLRVSEAASLDWSRVDAQRGVIRVMGKGGTERIVALPPMTIQALMRLPREGRFVFGEKALSTRMAYEIVRARGARAGLLQPLHPHALRHSYATHLLSSGANLRTLQELLGHRTLQATQRYTHIGLDQLARTMERHHPLGETALEDNALGARKKKN